MIHRNRIGLGEKSEEGFLIIHCIGSRRGNSRKMIARDRSGQERVTFIPLNRVRRK